MPDKNDGSDRVALDSGLQVRDDGTISTPRFDLPFSSFASPEAALELVDRARTSHPSFASLTDARAYADERVAPMLEAARLLFPCRCERTMVDDIPIDTFVPSGGVTSTNANRVLINLHGGGFVAGGGGAVGAVESMPIAAELGVTVISVDYRLSPEHRYPAASEDLERIYREVLNTYPAPNIGIYGGSAGGILTGEAVPWFLERDLPLPGALGIISASLFTFDEGDSAQLWPRMGSAIRNVPPPRPEPVFGRSLPYFAGVSTTDPVAVPGNCAETMTSFPPTLFLTGTRAPEMSGAAHSHLLLTELGVTSQLLLFDGMDHSFLKDPRLPESRRAYRLIAAFFDKHLAY